MKSDSRTLACLSFSQSRAALERRSDTTAAGSKTDEKQQQQGKAAGDVLRTGLNGPNFRWKSTRRRLPDRLSQSSKAYRVEDSFGGGKNDVLVGFGSAEDQIHLDTAGESNFEALKGVKWQIPVFDGTTTS